MSITSRESGEKPTWWFRSIEECASLSIEPEAIEYLKIDTGETFIHVGGTAYWRNGKMNIDALRRSGITHWRLKPNLDLDDLDSLHIKRTIFI